MGCAMAELFAEEGAKLVITARGKEQLDAEVEKIKKMGHEDVIGVVADNQYTEDIKRVIKTAVDAYGDLDIVLNNAGIGEQKSIEETEDEWMEFILKVNLEGPMKWIRESLKIFRPKNDGVIINVSSVNGERPMCGAAYTSSKGGLNTLTKNVAMLLNDTNIRVNAHAHRPTLPIWKESRRAESPGKATTTSICTSQGLNVNASIRLGHACIWPVKWEDV